MFAHLTVILLCVAVNAAPPQKEKQGPPAASAVMRDPGTVSDWFPVIPDFPVFPVYPVPHIPENGCHFDHKFVGKWGGVKHHSERTEEKLNIERDHMDAILGGSLPTQHFHCRQKHILEDRYLLVTEDNTGFLCLSFVTWPSSMVKYTATTNNPDFKPIPVANLGGRGVDSLSVYTDCGGSVAYGLDIARRYDGPIIMS